MLLLISGVVKVGWWTASLAVILWSGSSGWAWLRTWERRCSTEPDYSRVVFSNTSSRNTSFKIAPFITASCPNTQGWGLPRGNGDFFVCLNDWQLHLWVRAQKEYWHFKTSWLNSMPVLLCFLHNLVSTASCSFSFHYWNEQLTTRGLVSVGSAAGFKVECSICIMWSLHKGNLQCWG